MEPWGTPMCDFQFTSHFHPARWFQSVNFTTFSCSSASASPPSSIISISAFASFLHAHSSSSPSFSLLLLSVSVAVPHHPSLSVLLFIFWSLLLKSWCWCSCHGDCWWKDECRRRKSAEISCTRRPCRLFNKLTSVQSRRCSVPMFQRQKSKMCLFFADGCSFFFSAQSEMNKRTLDACKWVWPSSEQGHAALILGKTCVTETLTEKERRVHVYRFVSAR